MKTYKIILVFIGIIILYIATINIINISDKEISTWNHLEIKEDVVQEEVGINGYVSILVERNRWYGTLIEDGNIKEIYLCSIIKLPLKKGTRDYVILHYLFLSNLMLLILLVLIFELLFKKEIFK